MDIKSIILICIAIAGWIVTYIFDRKKERQQKKNDLKAKYLIATYNRLNKLRTHQKNLSLEECMRLLNECLSETELFGSSKQIKIARKLGKEASENHGKLTSLNELANDIRNSLREYIGLSNENEDTYYFVLPKTEK